MNDKDKNTNIFTFLNRDQGAHELLKKIKFPHGMYNTVEELISANTFPSVVNEWPSEFGSLPTEIELLESKMIYEREKYPNMYRY